MGDGLHSCTCTPVMIHRYRRRLSGPLLDRIDLHIEVPRISHKELSDSEEAESSAAIRARVERARQIQRERFTGSNTICNAAMKPRLLKVARTIADLNGCEQIQQSHLAVAIQYRSLDRRTS